MALGEATVSLQPGGGQQQPSAAQRARSLVVLGCSPLLPPNTLASISDPSAIAGTLDLGVLAECIAFIARAGQTRYMVAINPSVAGEFGDVAQTGIGTGVIKVSCAPHRLVEIQIYTAGTLGTMQIKYRVGGVGSFSAPVTSGSSSPWSYRVPGTYCVLAFTSGTYVLNSTYAIGTDGSLTLGGSAIANLTFTASPVDYCEVVATVQKAGILGAAFLGLSLDNDNATIPGQLTPSTGVVVLPNTGLVITCGQHVILITITTAGALGTAIYSYAVDGGSAVTGQTTTPNSGGNYVVTIPGTGVTLTFAPGTYVLNSTYTVNADGSITRAGSAINTVTQVWAGFVAGDVYIFLAAPPSYTTQDLEDAIAAARSNRTFQAVLAFACEHPSSTASGYSQAATLESEMQDAFNTDGLDWQSACSMPSSLGGAAVDGGSLGDIVVVSSKAVRDTADTDTVVRAGRGSDTLRTSVFAAMERVASKLTARFPLRPTSWLAAHRFVDTDPKRDLAAKADGELPVFVPSGATQAIGRDEDETGQSLDDIQINTLRTYRSTPLKAFFSITAGATGWKNMTTNADYQVASALRVLNAALPELRAVGDNFLGADADVNPDGTISEQQARAWTTIADNEFKRSTGLLVGGDYDAPQASIATATVLRTSQLGTSPKRLDIQYTFEPRGEVTQVSSKVRFSGVLRIGG